VKSVISYIPKSADWLVTFANLPRLKMKNHVVYSSLKGNSQCSMQISEEDFTAKRDVGDQKRLAQQHIATFCYVCSALFLWRDSGLWSDL